MLFINRLKQYNFSLEEIRTIITSEEMLNEKLCLELIRKRKNLKTDTDIFPNYRTVK